MARDEGFTDISNGDDLKPGQPELSSFVNSAPPITKHTYVHGNNNTNGRKYSNSSNPIASFTTHPESTLSGQTTCKEPNEIETNNTRFPHQQCVLITPLYFFFIIQPR